MYGGSFQRTATCYVTLFNILPLFSLFLSFFSPSPPTRELHGTWAKFLDTVRAYPFNHPVGDETSVEKERKFYPWREYLYFI